ncbi:FtsQ-type POTRA domain-containing protein [Herbiconiux liangxiaofengii]|uniref:FtsQ-type POTRA domain-containing protein n=1 Tax=Herbiconiux liangxiaofengii TaxID=3342795 RepID=UPI0035BB1838
MKRPPGITPPPPPAAEPPGERPGRPAAPRSQPRKPAARPAAKPAAERPAAKRAAEPSAAKRAAEPAAAKSAGRTPADAELTQPIEFTTPLIAPRPEKAADDKPDGASGDRRRSGAGDAKRQLRKATAARRRYERAEARRFTQRSRRRRIAWMVVGGSLAGLVLVVLLTAYSPLLAVRQIAVEGTSRLDQATVAAALDDQLGKPLALVDYGAIQRDLAGFPLVESYSVEARPPDTLAVRLIERRPVALLQTPTQFQLIDAAGVVVQTSPDRIPGFPVLDLTGTEVGSPGFQAAAAVLMSLPDALLSQVDRISGTTPDSVTLVFTGAGQRVVWGDAEQSELKAQILQRLIATQDPSLPVEYDVSSPQSPVIR